jgi:predicted GNAT family N-acyltransferase
MNVETRIFPYNSPDYRLALDLRYRILRKPLGLQFTEAELKRDEKGTHFGLFVDDKMEACLTLVKIDQGIMQMRQVAVEDDVQGKGLGKMLSMVAEKYALEKGCTIIFCHARKTAVPFYEKLGYQIASEEFIEVNIPHYVMEKAIGQ